MEFFGWISAIFLFFCGVPEASRSIKNGITTGISILFVWMWYVGELSGLIYILTMKQISLPLLTNYAFNVIIVSILLWYKYFPRRNHDKR